MSEFKVVEKFISINGEGVKAGQLTVFIRFQGCNLDCSYCDTSWANKIDADYVYMDEEEIYDYIIETGIKNVTLTGGEPLLQKSISSLLEKLSQNELISVEIETNGSVLLKEFYELKHAPIITMDYKLPSSGMEQYMLLDNFKYLKKEDTVKFVVGSSDDLDKAKNVIENYKLTDICHVYISPVFGEIENKEIVEFLIDNKLNDVNMQLQMHKIIWEPNMRGV